MENKELFEWELKAEREYNNALTGNLEKEKQAYLQGVKDAYEDAYKLKYEVEDLKDEIRDLNSEIEDLKIELERYRY